MEDYNRISLGFAEFVSQLLHETFEATLSAQNYQLEKYIEIGNIVELSNNRFFDLYLNDDSLEEKMIDIFGVKITNQMLLTPETISIIKDKLGDLSGIVQSNKLTDKGHITINQYLKDILVKDKKDTLLNILNKTETTRLVVDSGMIRAKLELTNLYQDLSPHEGKTESNTAKVSKAIPDKKGDSSIDQLKDGSNNYSSRSILSKNIIIKEIKDTDTNEIILIVDKSSISDKSKVVFSPPNVRIIAKPPSINSNINLLSEIEINFKTA